MNINCKYSFFLIKWFQYTTFHSVHPPFCKGGFTGPQFLEGVDEKEGSDLFDWVGLQFLRKKLKSEIFNDKKS